MKSSTIMIKDGAPKALFLTPEQRRVAWEKNPPKQMPAFAPEPKPIDPSTQRFLDELEAQEQARTVARVERTTKTPEARPQRPPGTFLLREWATSSKLDPRDVRAAARAVASSLRPLEVLKYTYAIADQSKVADIINAQLEKAKCPPSSKQPSKSSSAVATKLTPKISQSKPSSPSSTKSKGAATSSTKSRKPSTTKPTTKRSSPKSKPATKPSKPAPRSSKPSSSSKKPTTSKATRR